MDQKLYYYSGVRMGLNSFMGWGVLSFKWSWSTQFDAMLFGVGAPAPQSTPPELVPSRHHTSTPLEKFLRSILPSLVTTARPSGSPIGRSISMPGVPRHCRKQPSRATSRNAAMPTSSMLDESRLAILRSSSEHG